LLTRRIQKKKTHWGQGLKPICRQRRKEETKTIKIEVGEFGRGEKNR